MTPPRCAPRVLWRVDERLCRHNGLRLRRKKRQLRKVPTNYTKQVRLYASRERVFKALATLNGLRGWWTLIVTGKATTGGELRLGFAGLDEYIIMRVVKNKRPSSMYWTCVIHTSLPEWKETQPRFDLVEETSGSCRLDFQHIGLTPQFECFDDCRLGWDHFLASLVAYVERGAGMSYGA